MVYFNSPEIEFKYTLFTLILYIIYAIIMISVYIMCTKNVFMSMM